MTAIYRDIPADSSQQARSRWAHKIFVALDYSDLATAGDMIDRLAPLGVRFKIGLQLLTLLGEAEILALSRATGGLFLDFKLYDIAQTVTHAVQSIVRLDPAFVTVVGEPHVMRAALEGKGDSPLRLLGVTVLTSLDQTDLRESGYAQSAAELVLMRARQASDIGLDGLICSPHEVATIRQQVGKKMCLITPGVRPAGSALGDQKRVMTPSEALQTGADYLVIGRPITAAPDPVAATQSIIDTLFVLSD